MYGRAQCITTTRFDGHHPPPSGQNPTDFWPSRRPRNPPAAPAAVPAANLGPGTRPEPAPTTHGGYGRNTTGGWLVDDPRVVPLRPRACGGVVLGLVYRRREETLPAAPYHGRAGIWTIARENGVSTSRPRGVVNQAVKHLPVTSNIMAVRSTSAGFYTFEIVRSVGMRCAPVMARGTWQ